MKKTKRILLIQGHPDPAGGHFGHALAEAYRKGAVAAGHEVRSVAVAALSLPLVRSAEEWRGKPPDAVVRAQQDVLWAQHLVLFFPLWLGDMPALVKGFLEQLLRPGFALPELERSLRAKKKLASRSARLVVTMGMPAIFYSVYYRAHAVKSLKRNILQFVGFDPVRMSLIGMVDIDSGAREEWLEEMEALGKKGG